MPLVRMTTILISTTLLWAAPALQARPQNKGKGDRYALLVGVRDYVNKELNGLKYVEPDIVDLAKVLIADGYRRNNVMIMSQTQAKHDLRSAPEGAKILKELDFLLQDKTEADSVVVAFTGHGVQFQGEDELYLCPADAKLTDRDSLLPVSKIYQRLEKCPAGFKLLLVDACRNDPLSNLAKSAPGVKVESVTRPRRKEPPGGVMAFFSCSAGEQSYEGKELQHGVFFNYVIDALRGTADLDENGQVEVEEMMLHVRKRVPEYVRARLNNDQRPEFHGKFRDGVLATVSKTKNVQLSGGFANPTDLKIRSAAKSADKAGPRPVSPGDLKEADQLLRLALMQVANGEFEEAIEGCEKALRLARDDDGIAVRAYTQLSGAHARIGNEDSSRQFRELAEKRSRKK